MTDICVVGLVMGSHVIEDIGVTVPHGVTVTIPADQAYRSKNLWQDISQRRVMQVRYGPVNRPVVPPNRVPPPPPIPAPPPPMPGPDQSVLLDALARQGKEMADLRTAMAEQRRTMDAMIAALALSGVPAQAVARSVPQAVPVVPDDIPVFVPSAITPTGASARIDIRQDEGTDAAVVDDTLARLREARKKAPR